MRPLPFPLHTALYRIAEIRKIESMANAALPAGHLMQAAGKAAADFAKSLIRQKNGKILILAGPGYNGGDALETAHILADEGFDVSIILCGGIAQLSTEARQCLERAQASKSKFLSLNYLTETPAKPWSLVIDGLFGIGLARPICGDIAQLITRLNHLSSLHQFPVLALDVPSGLNADTGQVVGAAGIAVIATHTLTFIGNKPGLHTGAGRDYCGRVKVADLAIERTLFPLPGAYLSQPQMFFDILQKRQQDSHKGSFGEVLILGGATGMVGAPLLSARAAIHCGAGRVYVGFVATPPLFDNQYPELMCRQADKCDFSRSVLVIGPGLGDSEEAELLLMRALNQAIAIVIDADALNLIAAKHVLQAQVLDRFNRNAPTIMTPHPLEAARLLGITTQEVQADRWQSAQALVQKFKASIVLKGSGTVVAAPDTSISINTTGNPALATAGTGDVLAGICGALLAQQVTAPDAARIAVWLHGLAADKLVAQGVGPVGLSASELIPAIRTCLNQLIAGSISTLE